MIETETITSLTKSQYPLFVTIRFFSNNVLKNKSKGNTIECARCRKASTAPGISKNYENSDIGSQMTILRKCLCIRKNKIR